jgi:hypothetical protein
MKLGKNIPTSDLFSSTWGRPMSASEILTREPFFRCAWTEKAYSFGKVAEPKIPISIFTKDGEWQTFVMKIDTGACITLLSAEDCDLLGYELKAGTRSTLYAVGGRGIKVYVHELNMMILNRIFREVRVAFWDDRLERKRHKRAEPARLFGIADIFDQLQVTLRSRILSSFLTAEQ